jgi:hypothetical protein
MKYDFPFAAFNLNLVQGLKTTKTEQDTSSSGGDKFDYSFDDVALQLPVEYENSDELSPILIR